MIKNEQLVHHDVLGILVLGPRHLSKGAIHHPPHQRVGQVVESQSIQESQLSLGRSHDRLELRVFARLIGEIVLTLLQQAIPVVESQQHTCDGVRNLHLEYTPK